MKKLKVYISHPIRGIKKSNDIKANCAKAIDFVNKLRQEFSQMEFFCPAEGDWKIVRLWQAGKLSEQDILWADCEQIKECNGILVYDWEKGLSAGMEEEYATALFNRIPIYVFDKPNFTQIKRFLERL